MKKVKSIKRLILPLAAAMAVNAAALPSVSYAYDDDEEFSVGVRGDYNGDGQLSVFDLMRLSRYLLGTGSSPEITYETDINGDGVINIVDFSILKSALTKNIILWNMNNLPVMDGSTSEIPLETGIKSKLLGITYRNAGKLVHHHKTHESFKMLLSGENDLIFTVPISESQQKEADEAGVKLNFAPVAKEGFVFVVNKNNPVDTLTQDQIKDIYSGKITNWKELGGNDEKIIPYQRNNDSGSQNYMTEFMKDSELVEPIKENILGSMGTLMDAIAVYDNADGAIGYSVYSYAAQMYENSDDVKFIAVDGIKPSRETMADSTYPLLSDSYIIYTDSASQNTLDFVEWALSDEGQLCVLENGYVPVKEMEYPERLRAYSKRGTGEAKAEDYKPTKGKSIYSNYVEITENKDKYIDFLKDKEFQKTVNADIQKAVDTFDLENSTLECISYIQNGYMSIVIQEVNYDESEYHSDYRNVQTLNYNLKNNTKIEQFSDYFYYDENYVELINNTLSKLINQMDPVYVKTDFIGLTGSIDTFTLDQLYLNKDNPYLIDNECLVYKSEQLQEKMVTGQYFDNTQVVDEIEAMYVHDGKRPEWVTDISVEDSGDIRIVLGWSAFHTKEETEERQNCLDKIFYKATKLIDHGYFRTTIEYPSESNERNTLNVYIVKYNGSGEELLKKFYFDCETGDQIFLSDIFGKEFEKYNDIVFEINDIDLKNNTVTVSVESDDQFEYCKSLVLDFDPEHVNMKYINEASFKVEPVEFSKEIKGIIDCWGDAEVYSSEYVLDFGACEQVSTLEDGRALTVKRRAYSHNRHWFECWDAKTGEYCGWVAEFDINLS